MDQGDRIGYSRSVQLNDCPCARVRRGSAHEPVCEAHFPDRRDHPPRCCVSALRADARRTRPHPRRRAEAIPMRTRRVRRRRDAWPRREHRSIRSATLVGEGRGAVAPSGRTLNVDGKDLPGNVVTFQQASFWPRHRPRADFVFSPDGKRASRISTCNPTTPRGSTSMADSPWRFLVRNRRT